MIRYFLLATFFFTLSQFGLAAPKFKSEKAVQKSYIPETDGKLGGRFRFEVESGFHINEKAPNRAVALPEKSELKINSIDAKNLEFIYKKSKSPSKDQKTNAHIRTTIYVCDDDLTVCEERNWYWSLTGEELLSAPKLNENPVAVQSVRMDEYGFIQDDLDRAKNDCVKNKKPILALFSAQWCPGCMRMKKEVWANRKIKGTLNQFTKLKFDSDRFTNKPVMDKYEVAGIPSMLILNCSGEEVSRFVDYQPPDSFSSALSQILNDPNPRTRADLVQLAKDGDHNSARTLALRSALSGADEDALSWFQLMPVPENEILYWWAKLGVLRKNHQNLNSSTSKKKLLTALESALKKFPEVPSSFDWMSEAAELEGEKSKAGQKYFESIVTLSKKLLLDEDKMAAFNALEISGDYTGIEYLKIHYAKATAHEALAQTELAALAWSDGVKAWDNKKMTDEPSGQYFRFLAFLKKTKAEDRINRTFEKHLKSNPNDGEILRRYAQVLYDFGQYEKSLKYAERALKNSFDRNEIFAALAYAKSLNQLDRSREAKSFLLKYLARNDLTSGSRADITSLLTKIK